MRRLEFRQRTNSDVWILHVACKFRGLFHKPPTLYRYWEPSIYFKWQKQGSLSSFRPITGWGLHRIPWKSQREYLKGRPIECYHFSTHLFSHWSTPLRRHYLKTLQLEILNKFTKRRWSGSEFEPDSATAWIRIRNTAHYTSVDRIKASTFVKKPFSF